MQCKKMFMYFEKLLTKKQGDMHRTQGRRQCHGSISLDLDPTQKLIWALEGLHGRSLVVTYAPNRDHPI